MISIITVNYNNVSGLRRTINSVISQNYVDIEFIIVDGLSTDGSVDVIKSYSSYISKCICEPDSGIYNAMNKGIRIATGDYCIFMNSGDMFFSSDVLQKMIPHFASGYDIYNGNAIYIKRGKIVWYRKAEKDVSINQFVKSSICHQASFIKTSLLKRYMYDEHYSLVSDWKFWIQVLCLDSASYKAVNVDVCCYDAEGRSLTQIDIGKREREEILRSLFSPDKLYTIKIDSNKKRVLRYIIKGLQRRFWLLFSFIFKVGQVKRLY